MIKGITHAYQGPIWYHSEPSDVHYSLNQFLGWDFFCRFLQKGGSTSDNFDGPSVTIQKFSPHCAVHLLCVKIRPLGLLRPSLAALTMLYCPKDGLISFLNIFKSMYYTTLLMR